MNAKLFYNLNNTDIEYQLKTIVDGNSERTIIRTLSYKILEIVNKKLCFTWNEIILITESEKYFRWLEKDPINEMESKLKNVMKYTLVHLCASKMIALN